MSVWTVIPPRDGDGFIQTYLNAVPVLAREGVLGLLLEALLALGQSLVPKRNFGLANLLVAWVRCIEDSGGIRRRARKRI